MESSSLDALRQRIERLESWCHRWKLMSVTALTAAALLLGLGGAQLPPPPTPQRGPENSLVLRDIGGRVRAILAISVAETPALVFYDEKGTERARLGLANDSSPSLSLCDKNGRIRFAVGLTKDDTLGLSIFDERGSANMRITSNADNTFLSMAGNRAGINLRSGRLKNQLSIEAGPGDKAYVAITGEDGKDRLGFGTGPGGKAGLQLWDAIGRYRIGLGILQGNTGLVLVGDDGKPFFQVPKGDTSAK